MIGLLGPLLVSAALAGPGSEAAPDPILAPPAPPTSWEDRAWLRGRRISTSGLFLGWAGIGLTAGGATLAISGRETGPVSNRDLLASSVIVGGGLASLGMGLQVLGTARQRRATPLELRPPRTRDVLAGCLAGASLVSSSLLAWRLLDDGPDGLWIAFTAPIAVGGAIGATGLHTISLVQADGLARDAGIRATIGPGFVLVEGRF